MISALSASSSVILLSSSAKDTEKEKFFPLLSSSPADTEILTISRAMKNSLIAGAGTLNQTQFVTPNS